MSRVTREAKAQRCASGQLPSYEVHVAVVTKAAQREPKQPKKATKTCNSYVTKVAEKSIKKAVKKVADKTAVEAVAQLRRTKLMTLKSPT